MAVVRGVTFALDRPDGAYTFVCDRLAPVGYLYLLVADGQATLGAVLLEGFRESNQRLDAAIVAVERQFGIRVPTTAARWGGHADFRVPTSAAQGNTLLVGEAAGFQDATFGFGIRSAMLSGALAAVAIDEHHDYDAAWRHRLLPSLLASQVNRMIYLRAAGAKKALWWWLRAHRDGITALRRVYAYSPWHRLMSPMASFEVRRCKVGRPAGSRADSPGG